jgi:hypothetical protein
MLTTADLQIPVSIKDTEHIQSVPDAPIFVLFTSVNLTQKAIQKAREIAGPLGAQIAVIVLQVVPYPLPLDEPPAPFEFIVRRFKELLGESQKPTSIQAFICRDPVEALKRILDPNAAVFIGVKAKWFPSHDERLARKLSCAGYDVRIVKAE